MIDVVALGELLIDFAAKSTDSAGYPTMAANPGGAPGNFLAALNAYGRKTAFLGKVGNDAFGNLLLGTLNAAGIETKGILVDDSVFTTLAFVTFDESGDRAFSFARKPGADTQLRWEEVDKSLIDEAKVFHFGTLSLTDEPVRTATQKAVAYAKAQGKLISCDPNLRLPLWPDADAAKEQMLWSLRQADVVKISDNEVEFLWNCTPEEGADKLLKLTLSLGAGEPERTVVSGIAKFYTPEEMVGKQVVVVANLRPAKLRGIRSEGMILCASDAQNKTLKLVTVEPGVEDGADIR